MTHICHAYKCERPVAPKMFMCGDHWYVLPRVLRDTIWDTYRKGQEIDKRPSREYLDAARAAINWLKRREGYDE